MTLKLSVAVKNSRLDSIESTIGTAAGQSITITSFTLTDGN